MIQRDQMLARQQDEVRFKDTRIAQLTHEIAALKRYQFGEQLSGLQGTLLEEAVGEDMSEKLDYIPDVLQVECHVLGKRYRHPAILG